MLTFISLDEFLAWVEYLVLSRTIKFTRKNHKTDNKLCSVTSNNERLFVEIKNYTPKQYWLCTNGRTRCDEFVVYDLYKKKKVADLCHLIDE